MVPFFCGLLRFTGMSHNSVHGVIGTVDEAIHNVGSDDSTLHRCAARA